METLQPVIQQYLVPNVPSGCESEFEVQARLFCLLQDAGFDVRGEVNWSEPETYGSAYRRQNCRFDLVLYENGRAIHIVEVKARPVKHKNGLEATRQAKRYQAFGVPVTFVYGREDAESFLQNQLQRRDESSTCVHGRAAAG